MVIFDSALESESFLVFLSCYEVFKLADFLAFERHTFWEFDDPASLHLLNCVLLVIRECKFTKKLLSSKSFNQGGFHNGLIPGQNQNMIIFNSGNVSTGNGGHQNQLGYERVYALSIAPQ